MTILKLKALGDVVLNFRTQLTNRGWHFTPLQHHILDDSAIGVNVDTLILIAQKHLHAICVWQEYDGVRVDLTLDLQKIVQRN